jgi:choline dehydrogenase-like flavoprotein
MISKGLPLDHDMFSHGERSHGCGHVPRSTYKGYRSTAADFITKKSSNNNITVLTEMCVDKVLLEQDTSGKLRATGIRVARSDGTKAAFFATKEVVISAGTYCTPNILNRSGIGAQKDLMALGIDTIVDIPAVGQNLMDHLIVFMFYETECPGLTTDHLIHHGDGFATSYQKWKDTKSGFLASFPSGVFAFARLDERLQDSPLWREAKRQPGRDPMGLGPGQPHIEIWNTECYDGPRQFDCFPAKDQHIFGIIVELFAPQSRGTVTLKSNDPLDLPKVDCGYLTNSLDVEVLAEACCFANEIVMKGEGTKDIIKGTWPPQQQHHLYTTREQWIPYVKKNATTCK